MLRNVGKKKQNNKTATVFCSAVASDREAGGDSYGNTHSYTFQQCAYFKPPACTIICVWYQQEL